MDPDVAATIEALKGLITFLVAFLATLALYIKMAPIGECDRCDHCRNERLHRSQWARCPVCFKHHRPSDPHP